MEEKKNLKEKTPLVDDNRPFEVPDCKEFVAPVCPDPAHEDAYFDYIWSERNQSMMPENEE